MKRTAVLIDDNDRRVGRTNVPESVFIIKHSGVLYVRTDTGLRLPGGGIGIRFIATDPYVRERLDPA